MHALLAVVVALAGAAAEPVSLKRGTEVRIYVDDGQRREVLGRLLSSDPATITVQTEGGPRRLERAQLYLFQHAAAGGRRNRTKGAYIGGAITGVAGLIAGVVLVAKESNGGSCDQCGIAVMMVGAAAALPGAGIGYAIGAPERDWRDVKPHAVTVVDRRSAPRVMLALRLGRR